MAALSAWARRRGAPPETARKLLHVEMALVTLSFPWLFVDPWPVVALAVAAEIWFRLLRVSPRLEARFGYALRAACRDSHGESWFACGVCLAFLLTGGDPLAYCITILVLGFADTAAALAGRRYGRARRMPGGASKSVAGSAAFFVVAFAVTLTGLHGVAQLPVGEAVAAASVLATVTTALEAVAGKGMDNLLVPLGALASLRAFALV
jgi:phytol kinase